MICDFCSVPDPRWRYQAETYQSYLGARSMNDWMACDECAELIETHQWRKLGERSLRLCPTAVVLVSTAGYDKALAEVMRMHREFDRHRHPRKQVA